jgi:hypothetical protein
VRRRLRLLRQSDTGGMCSRCYSMRRSDGPLYQV